MAEELGNLLHEMLEEEFCAGIDSGIKEAEKGRIAQLERRVVAIEATSKASERSAPQN